MNETYLEHHGILGQKWGVRRYQNKDGSLTSAGEKRYGNTRESRKESRKELKNFEKDYARSRGVQSINYQRELNEIKSGALYGGYSRKEYNQAVKDLDKKYDQKLNKKGLIRIDSATTKSLVDKYGQEKYNALINKLDNKRKAQATALVASILAIYGAEVYLAYKGY